MKGWWSLAAVLAGVAILFAGFQLARGQRLTIVVISLDTTRADHLTPYGYDRATTPTLARLARQGTVFTSARSTSSWTLPSHMSLFTGLPPDLHNVSIDFQRLDRGQRTMGEIFSEADFRTIGLYTAPYVHPRFGFARGMDFYEAMTKYPMAYDLLPEEMEAQQGTRELLSHRERTSEQLVNRAAYFLSSRLRPRNFAFLHFFDPHYDYRAPGRITRMFVDPAYAGPVTGDDIMNSTDIIHADMPPEDREHLIGLYDAELRWVDEHIGLLINTIEQRQGSGSTIVVVVADHGEEFFEAGRFGHRMTLRDEVLRIPMLFWGPEIIPEGQVIEDDVAIYDVLPTLMDYADIEPDADIYGRSLRPLIEGGALPPRPVSASLTFFHRDGPPYYTRHDTVVYEGMKYVRKLQVPWSPEDPTNIYNEPDLETRDEAVYDLRVDPGEQRNLFSERGTDPRIQGIIDVFDEETTRQKAALESLDRIGVPFLPGDAFDPKNMDIFEMMSQVGYL